LHGEADRQSSGITHAEGEEATTTNDEGDNAALMEVNISRMVLDDDVGPE
jgi:hypothetical protein